MKLHAIEAGNFKLDGGAMFGVVPKVIWNRTNPADENNLIDMAVDFSTVSDLSEVILAATLEVDGEVLYFSSADLKMYLQNTDPLNGWATAHHTIKLSDINLNYNKVWLKFFIWNIS